ncbi:HupE/UreJ family protein [Hydrogenophaga sp. PBL-H3]|uniref:HupE/UreJ family protein n=1 Tax=Hydrogenophaga sp. PBL-H3 TaxID=434010 RepID=UPI00131FC35D|nr:HupE/UreJ family protein [Hydrogenophaga sp. PBL-H3]QHE76898.1 HupE/UreJ family protein [Hydrogenophaga sp. PBL-H3]QHE81322.1 HupE/UreJ family protein [Hydrogenophaga sp. PBL-H3]
MSHLFRRFAARLVLPAVFALLACAAAPALAHSSSNSYLTLSQRGSDLVLRTDINLRDVDLIFDLDDDRDGRVSWGETATRIDELKAWMQQGISVRGTSAACQLQPLDVMASPHSDGFYLSAEWRVACADPEDVAARRLTLKYGLIFDQDNLHRGLLKVDLPGAQSSAILSPDRPEAALQAGEVSGWAVFTRYVIEGIWHIWIGIDHILFLLSLLVLAPLVQSRKRVTQWAAVESFRISFMDVLAVVTAFTVAHSITLAASILGWINPPVAIIESVIALSVILAALNNLLGWLSLKRWRLAFAFGLIHGFGFANVLIDLALPAQQLALALGGFNVGVELGQLAIVLAFVPLAWWLRHTTFYRWGVVVLGSLAIAVVATVWLAQRMGV